jgi:hypothetical protein
MIQCFRFINKHVIEIELGQFLIKTNCTMTKS